MTLVRKRTIPGVCSWKSARRRAVRMALVHKRTSPRSAVPIASRDGPVPVALVPKTVVHLLVPMSLVPMSPVPMSLVHTALALMSPVPMSLVRTALAPMALVPKTVVLMLSLMSFVPKAMVRLLAPMRRALCDPRRHAQRERRLPDRSRPCDHKDPSTRGHVLEHSRTFQKLLTGEFPRPQPAGSFAGRCARARREARCGRSALPPRGSERTERFTRIRCAFRTFRARNPSASRSRSLSLAHGVLACGACA